MAGGHPPTQLKDLPGLPGPTRVPEMAADGLHQMSEWVVLLGGPVAAAASYQMSGVVLQRPRTLASGLPG